MNQKDKKKSIKLLVNENSEMLIDLGTLEFLIQKEII